MPVTRMGLQIPSFTFAGVPDEQLFEKVASIAMTAEDAGFDSLWVMDHYYQIRGVGPRTEPMLEAYTLLAALAARTRRLSLGTMVTGVTYRNPAMLAKMVTTLDIISSGRAILGLGAAWNNDEHAGYGFEFPPVGERMRRLEEALRICRGMFTEEAPTYKGRHFAIDAALNNPRPVRGNIPILVGGGGETRTLQLVARFADASNVFGDVQTVRHKLEVLANHCADLGRDPATITKTRLGSLHVAPTANEAQRAAEGFAAARGIALDQFRAMTIYGSPEQVREQVEPYLEAGLDGLIFNMPDAGNLDSVRLAGETLSKVLV